MSFYHTGFFICAFLLCFSDSGFGQQRRSSSSNSGSGTSASQVVDFDCPEEFGYYPHPADCTQYYVCVFGGALLESCTGGLMYSHELQTCDWPRNVGCGSGGAPEVQVVSTAKTQEPSPRQRPQQQLSRQQQHQQQHQQHQPPPQQQQQQQQQQQYPPQRPLQREEAIPKHHLYAEEELGPAEEVESDRQQRVYRGQPATLGQVARDRDGLSRHSNAIQIPQSNGREKLSVISFGTQQQYRNRIDTETKRSSTEAKHRLKRQLQRVSRQSISPPQYVEPTTTTRVTGRGYNTTQQQYTPSPYDPYYNIYEDDSDLYKDIDYSQYQGQQYQSQPKPPVVQQQVQAPPAPSPSRKPTLQYTPSPPPQSYNAVQQDVYNQAQDYNDNYNLQDEDIDYKQSDIDIKGNRSRTAKRHDPARPTTGLENIREKQSQTNLPLNRRLTLTASFSFDDDKTPVSSSRKLETRQRSSLNSFQVEDPPSSGPQRDTHELVLSYIKQENAAIKNKSLNEEKELKLKPNTYSLNTQTLQRESSPNADSKRYTYYLDDLETSEISSTTSPKTSEATNFERQTARPFRIVVPSSTEKPTAFTFTEETTFRPRNSIRRGNKHYEETSELSTTTNNIVETVKPYKLPPLSRETIGISLERSRLKFKQALEQKEEEEEEILNEARETLRRRNQIQNKQPEISPVENPSGPSNEGRTSINLRNKINYSQVLPNKQSPEKDSSISNIENATSVEPKEKLPVKEQTPLTYDSSSTSGNRYSSRLITTPSVEESVVKLIPIKPVRNRFQYEGKFGEDETYKKYTPEVSSSTPVRKLEHSYQVTEENVDLENYTPYVPLNRRYQQKKTESRTEENINSSNPKESIMQVNSQETHRNPSSRQVSRFPQTTEKPAQKSLYSLRIDNNGGNLKGEVGELVLATLEAITVSPGNEGTVSRSNAKGLTNTSESNSQEQKNSTQDIGQSVNQNNTPVFARSNQIRMRSQSRIYTLQNSPNVREYQNSPIEYTSTETNENEKIEFVPVRTPSNYRTKASTEFPSKSESPQTTEEKHATEATLRHETGFNRNSPNHPSTDDIDINRINNQPSRRWRYETPRTEEKQVTEATLRHETGFNRNPTSDPSTEDIEINRSNNQPSRRWRYETPQTEEKHVTEATLRHEPGFNTNSQSLPSADGIDITRSNNQPSRRWRYETPQTEEKEVTEGTLKQENGFSRTTESYPSSDLDDIDIIRNSNLPSTRLRYRNRLDSVTEDEGNDQSGVDKLDSDIASADFTQKKTENRLRLEKERENNEPSTSLNPEEYDFTRAREPWKTTLGSNEDETPTDEGSDDFQEAIKRRQNMRRMQIRKKIRITTEQPDTSSPDVTENTPTTSRSVRFHTETPQLKPVGKLPSESETSDDDISKVNRHGIIITGQKEQSDYTSNNQENYQNNRERGRIHFEQRENPSLKSNYVPLVVDPYTLISPSLSNDNKAINRTTLFQQTTSTTPRNNILRANRFETKPNIVTESFSPIAAEINSYFKEAAKNSTNSTTVESTTPYSMTTVERIRDKFRLGTFPKPAPSSNSFNRKPSVEDNTPPPLLSDKCSQELDSDPECGDKPLLRVRPTSASPDSQSTPGLTRGSSRNRGSATYTVSPNEAEPPQRGTPSSLSRNRPTLKPSTSIVSKASEFVDIYRYPPSRPEPIYPTPQVDKTAAKCRKDVCLLPDCSCGGKEIPGDLPVEETPQIVLLTFDDSVNDLNKGLYSDLFEKGRTNPNGCPISATFYVSHEWTDYSQVQNLYAGGHEIASHSVSHSFGEQFSVKKWTKEIAGQREILAAYGGVRQEDIRGMRAPFLAIGGNKMFKMLYDSNFTYDSSMPVYENRPPSWPYTLDYKIFHDCMIPPCPTRSYPGVWEVPMVMWQDLNGGRCSMGDACSNPPTADGVYKMLIKNFERHFTSNRSPFGLFYHAAWFTQPHHKEGFIAFLDTINKMPEVWVISNWQAIQWVRDPTPISRLNGFAPFGCNYPERPRKCMNPKVCNLWHKSGVRYMRTCQPCPDIYPWTGKTGVRNSRVDNEIITE